MQRQGELLTRRLQRGNDDLNEELYCGARATSWMVLIGRKLLEVLDRYARENGYTVVLDSSAQGSPVVYGSAQSDITQEIVCLYDEAYLIKGSAPACFGARASAPSRQILHRPRKRLPNRSLESQKYHEKARGNR